MSQSVYGKSRKEESRREKMDGKTVNENEGDIV